MSVLTEEAGTVPVYGTNDDVLRWAQKWDVTKQSTERLHVLADMLSDRMSNDENLQCRIFQELNRREKAAQ